MRMSISTTSGRCRSTAAEHAAAVVGLAHDLDPVGAGEHHPQARSARARRRRRAGRGSRRPRQRRAQDEVAAGAPGPCSSSPPASATRSPARSARCPRRAAAAGARRRRRPAADDLDDQPRPAPRAGTVDRRPRRPARACARSSAPPGRSGRRCARRGGHVGAARRSGARPASRPRATPRSAPGGRRASAAARSVPSSPSRSTPITSRSSCSAACAALADHAGGLGDLLRRRVGAELERAGVQAQQRHAVGEHVVHLARDPAALGLARLLDPQPLLGLEPRRPLAQREHELAPGAREQPPADHHDGRAAGRARGPAGSRRRRDTPAGSRNAPTSAIDRTTIEPRREARIAALKSAIRRRRRPRAPRRSRQQHGDRADRDGVAAPPPQRDERRRRPSAASSTQRASSSCWIAIRTIPSTAAATESSDVDAQSRARAPRVGAGDELARKQRALPAGHLGVRESSSHPHRTSARRARPPTEVDRRIDRGRGRMAARPWPDAARARCLTA